MRQPKPNGLKRLINATRYSQQGLKAVYHREAAFRQQVWLVGMLTVPAWLLPTLPLWLSWAITASAALCWMAEIFNSALEGLIDYLAPDHHPEAGYVKDLGSAAVFIAVMLWLFTWYIALKFIH